MPTRKEKVIRLPAERLQSLYRSVIKRATLIGGQEYMENIATEKYKRPNGRIYEFTIAPDGEVILISVRSPNPPHTYTLYW